MSSRTKILLGVFALFVSAQAIAEITLYEGEDFRGRAFTTNRESSDFKRSGFNNRASSVIVDNGRWEVCEDPGFRGRCVVLREGNYDSLQRMGLNNRLSSARRISNRDRDRYDSHSPEPLPAADYQFRRRPNERVYEARVTSVRAVMGRPEERCWVEREQVETRGNANVAGGIIGGVIGGILGHQIGNGKGVATAGGAVAGAAVGANVGRGRGDDYGRDVRRCDTSVNDNPDYWDVRYEYRNVEHRVQMSAPPGRTIYVNRSGDPRQ
ncbi:MAG: beta/gamma crystallin family protein [Steroidobacteraceae bacterium]